MSTLGKTIKQFAVNANNAENPTDIRIGMVESVSPLKVRLNQKIILTEPFLKLSRNVKDYDTKMIIEGKTLNVRVLNGLKKGENVLMISYQKGQKYLIIERAD